MSVSNATLAEARRAVERHGAKIREILGSDEENDCRRVSPDVIRKLVEEGLVPVLPDLDRQVLQGIIDTGRFDMSGWHELYDPELASEADEIDDHHPTYSASPEDAYNKLESCGTTHCLAGWAVMRAGVEGVALELAIGAGPAGCLLFRAAYPNRAVPDFYTGDREALFYWALLAVDEFNELGPMFDEALEVLDLEPWSETEEAALAHARDLAQRERERRERERVTEEERAFVAALIASARRTPAMLTPALTRAERERLDAEVRA